MTEITMPKLSDSMEEGTVIAWLKGEGELVAAGEDLVEIETDKATMAHPAEAGGVLRIVAAVGMTLPVGGLIATVADDSDGVAPADGATTETRVVAAAAGTVAPTATEAVPAALAPSAASPVAADAGVKASPVARRIARAQGLDLATVTGSGPRGRVTRADVTAAAGLPTPGVPPAVPGRPPGPAPSPAVATASAVGAKGATQVVQPTRAQALIARRMAESKATIPEFQVQTEVAMDEAVGLRAQLATALGDGPVPSFNDVIVTACARALRDHPRANASYRDGAFELHPRVNVGVAVAADEVLVVPTVFDADTKSLGQISREVRLLAQRVRDRSITPPELAGGTFTVSNLGMFGMTAITPVINAPQAAILGVGAIRPVLVRRDGQIADAQLLTLTLTCDHRILYGADAARFLSDVKSWLERPLALLL